MPFKDTNAALGIKNSKFHTGRANVDSIGAVLEADVTFPRAAAVASWVYYDCTIGVMLDSGIVVHNRLPQVNRLADTLASCKIDDPKLDAIVGSGVNLRCADQYADVVQRMGHARYWFRLWGRALRIGNQVPIPGIKTIGGVPAIPYDKNPQWAFNRIFPGGNYGGIILWHAEWSLWYTTTVPPTSQVIPASDPSAHISTAATQADAMQAPYSAPDDNAENSAPPVLSNIKG